MIPTNDEHYELALIKRVKNSPYEWEDAPKTIFKGRPANQLEKRNYRIQKGANGNETSTFIKATNLPEILDVGDTIEFLGKEWTVMSIGYYFDRGLIINPSIMSTEQIAYRCPKGINIQ